MFADIDRIDFAINADFQIMKRSLQRFIHFPHRYRGRGCGTCRCRWRYKSRPVFDGVVFVRIHKPLNDRFLRMRIEATETVHSPEHRLPVNWLLRCTKPEGSDLMAIRTHHLEVELVTRILKFEHAECAICWPLQLQFFTFSLASFDNKTAGTCRNITAPFVGQSQQTCANMVIYFSQTRDSKTAILFGEDRDPFPMFIVDRGNHYAFNPLT